MLNDVQGTTVDSQLDGSIPSRRCLNVTSDMDERFGGIAGSLPAFCKAVSSVGRYKADILSFSSESTTRELTREGVRIQCVPAGRIRWHLGAESRRFVEREVLQASVLHIHGIWQEHCTIAAGLARKLSIPYVISAHGMLEPWALNRKWWKKRAYWAAIERSNLLHARCLRALTKAEAQQYRLLGLRQPVAIIPNGVSVPDKVSAEPFFLRYPQLRGRKIVLFLGRIHQKKGVDLVCQAWAAVSRGYKDAHLVIAGPDDDGTGKILRALVEEGGLSPSVTFTGMLRGDQKWAALKSAWVFVLPSRSEGFSVAVLEAMGVGTPVIVSPQCYIPVVEQRDCGWIAEADIKDISTSLIEALQMSCADREATGARCRTLVDQCYQWAAVGQQMTSVLDWVLGCRRPHDVELLD